MARTETDYPIKELHGAVEKKGIVHRQKTFRDADGNIIAQGVKESYKPRKRDFKKKPAGPGELAQQQRWAAACRMAKEQLADPDLYASWLSRFTEQLTHATADTPARLVNGHRKIYYRFDAFVRAVLYASLS